MPRFSGVAGTTGYEWLNVLSHVWWTDVASTAWMRHGGTSPVTTGFRRDPGRRRSTRVIDTILASEFGVLARALARIAAGHFSTRDFTLERLRAALQLYVLEFPVYRTYVTAAGAAQSDRR